ncbi:MAG TPA: SRPBCC domain-containing protein [Caulobacteraceae bacterium]|nr:SRPBCC domain-containing protein [Caulobacteraceae bacterium]
MSEAPAAPPAEPIVVDCDLDEAPEQVWRALTEPELRSQWLQEADDCAEVVESAPNVRLRLAWRERDEGGSLVESDVTFTLTPLYSGGTRLRVVHDGFVLTPAMALARLPAALKRPRTVMAALAWAA